MTTATVSAFESTLQKTNIWLKDILAELNWQDSDYERAFHALRAVLHAVRDRLPVEESSDFAAQLPMLIRGIYYECWKPSKSTDGHRSREVFLDEIAASYSDDITTEEADIACAVFKVISKHVTPGEVQDVRGALPKHIRALWPKV